MTHHPNQSQTTPLFVLVSGTDTEVGKTFVGCALGHALKQKGTKIVSVKPLETGCGETVGTEEDGVLLAQSTGQEMPQAALDRFSLPVAPPVAAESQGKCICFETLMQQTKAFGEHADLVLVEGAGGLLSPLTWQHSALDMAKTLDAHVLLVAPNQLGVINHVRLALYVLKNENIHCLGVVLTPRKEDHDTDSSIDSNLHTLRRVEPDVSATALPRCPSSQQASIHMSDLLEWIKRAVDKHGHGSV